MPYLDVHFQIRTSNHLSSLIISYSFIWPQGSRDIAMCDLEQIALFFLPLITHFYQDPSHTLPRLGVPFLSWHLCYKLSKFGVNSSYSARDNLSISPLSFSHYFDVYNIPVFYKSVLGNGCRHPSSFVARSFFYLDSNFGVNRSYIWSVMAKDVALSLFLTYFNYFQPLITRLSRNSTYIIDVVSLSFFVHHHWL